MVTPVEARIGRRRGLARRAARLFAKTGWLRRTSQIGFAGFVAYVGVRLQLVGEEGATVASTVEAFCPFGRLETLYTFVATGGVRITATGVDAAEVRGWMTVAEVASAYEVPVTELYARFGVPANTPPTTQLKDLEPVAPGFNVTALRDWLRARPAAG
jgi:hypothetical protein